MAYRLKSSDRSISRGIRRIAAAEFALVHETLADDTIALPRKVHEARKATKRLRALLRLVAPNLPDAKSEIAALRDAARKLSSLRDRGALTETLARLELPDDLAQRLAPLIAPERASARRGASRLLKSFASDMEAAAGRAQSWSVSKKGWQAIEPGLRHGYRKLRRTAERAQHASEEEPIHEFRKQAKIHWYHTLLLRRVFPDVMDGYATAAERLCDDLGDWRDLGLLAEAISAVPAHRLPKPDRALALDSIETLRRRALKHAFRMVRLLISEPPPDYTSRLEAWWRAST